MSNLYVAPTSSGTGDGSSAANAAAIDRLPSLVQQAGAGGTVMLLADRGSYAITDPIILDAGGTAGAPVTIKGVSSSGAPMDAQFVGDRAANWTQGAAEGPEVFRLMNGADNLAFEHVSFRNVSNAIRAGADISNLAISHASAQNVTRFVEDYASGSNSTATISGLTIDDVSVTGYSKSVVRLQYDSHDIVVRNTTGDSQGIDGGFAMGIALDGTVHDVVLSNVIMRNNVYTGADYWNGDGFTTESGVYNVLFDHTVSSGNGDAGYDIKSARTVLDGAVAYGNNSNFKFWASDTVLKNSTGLDPYHRGGTGVQTQIDMVDGANVTVIDSTFTDSSPATVVFNMESSNTMLTTQNVAVSKAEGAFLGNIPAGTQLVDASSVTGSGSGAAAVMAPPAPVAAGGAGSDGGASAPVVAEPVTTPVVAEPAPTPVAPEPAPSLDPSIIVADPVAAPAEPQQASATTDTIAAAPDSLQASPLDPSPDTAGSADAGSGSVGGRPTRWATGQGLPSDHHAFHQWASDAAFVQGLYQHALDHQAAPAGFSSAAALLAGSSSPVDVALGAAEDTQTQGPFVGTDAQLA